MNFSMKDRLCVHPNHNDKETCGSRAVSCCADCECCNAPEPDTDTDKMYLLIQLEKAFSYVEKNKFRLAADCVSRAMDALTRLTQ